MTQEMESRMALKDLVDRYVTEADGNDRLTMYAVRYYDKYVKVDGRWWIAEREQHFVYAAVPPLA